MSNLPYRRQCENGYRGRPVRAQLPPALAAALWLLLALALFLFGVALYLQRYMVYSRDGATLVLPGQVEEVSEPSPNHLTSLTVVEETAPQAMRAYECEVDTLLSGEAPAMLEEVGANTLIVTLKPTSGVLRWSADLSDLPESVTVDENAQAIWDAIAACRAQGIAVIARVSLLRDDALTQDEALCLQLEDELFYDDDGHRWLDPNLFRVQELYVKLAEQLSALELDGILFSETQLPANAQSQASQEGLSTLIQLLAQATDGTFSILWDETVPEANALDNYRQISALGGEIWCTPSLWEALESALGEDAETAMVPVLLVEEPQWGEVKLPQGYVIHF
jgi:hypothetical protein